MLEFNDSTPILTFPLVRGCCRFSGFTTTAYPLRVQGGRKWFGANELSGLISE